MTVLVRLPLMVATLGVGLLIADPTTAALRCGSKLIVEGDRKIDVLASCGEPTLIEQPAAVGRSVARNGVHGRVSAAVVGPSSVEIWTYNFGPRRFMQLIRFNHGRVVEITSLDHGY